MTTRAEILAKIAAFFPQKSMANPTNSALNEALTLMLTDSGNPEQSPLTATADGLTTGLATADDEFITVTSASANNIVTLPSLADVSPGKKIRGWVGANGFEFRTPADSGQLINSVDSDGTNEAAIPATTMFELTAISETEGWILLAWTELGAAIAAIVPDAA